MPEPACLPRGRAPARRSRRALKITGVKNVKIVRLTHPENVFIFDVARPVDLKVPGDAVDWN